MSNPRNAKDALIAEMLGDIGKLQEAVDHLKTVLPAQTDAVEKRLFGVIGLLQKAGDSYQESLKSYTQSQGDTIRVQMEKDAHNARIKFQQDANEWASQAIGNVEKSVKDTLQAEITVPIRKLKAESARNAWKTILLCLCSGVVSGLMVYGGVVTLTHDPNLEADAHLGRALVSVWPKLDKRAKEIVEAEQRK